METSWRPTSLRKRKSCRQKRSNCWGSESFARRQRQKFWMVSDGGEAGAVALGSHQDAAAVRAIVALMHGPDLGAGFGGIDAAVLGKSGQLGPGLARRAVVGDLEDRMLEGLVGELHAEGAVEALDARRPRRRRPAATARAGCRCQEESKVAGPPIMRTPPPSSPQKPGQDLLLGGVRSAGRRLERTTTRKGASSSREVGKPLINSPALSTFWRKTDCLEVRVRPVSLMV